MARLADGVVHGGTTAQMHLESFGTRPALLCKSNHSDFPGADFINAGVNGGYGVRMAAMGSVVEGSGLYINGPSSAVKIESNNVAFDIDGQVNILGGGAGLPAFTINTPGADGRSLVMDGGVSIGGGGDTGSVLIDSLSGPGVVVVGRESYAAVQLQGIGESPGLHITSSSLVGPSVVTNKTVIANIDGNLSGSVGGIGVNGISANSIVDAALLPSKFGSDTGLQPIRSGWVRIGSTASTIVLDSSASSVNDFYKDATVYITSGTGVGQYAVISAYDGVNKVATINGTWLTVPIGNVSRFAILPQGKSAVVSGGGATADEVLDAPTETGVSLREAIRLILSFMFGKSSGGGSNQIVFRDVNDLVDRISLTVDAWANRLNVVLNSADPPP